MSPRLRSALPVLLTLACCPRPPESKTPEPPAPTATDAPATPVAPATPAATATPAADAPAAAAAPAIETLFVNSERAACEGEGARQCLQVRNAESEAWRNLYASIEGFEYEPAHLYELRVEVTRIAKPPADAPSLKYKLVQVVSKRKAGK